MNRLQIFKSNFVPFRKSLFSWLSWNSARNVVRLMTDIAGPSSHSLRSAEISQFDGKKTLKVFWNDGTFSHFPFVYLRDNCQCSACFEKSAQQRLYHFTSMKDFDVAAKSLSSNHETVTVTWPDGHQSDFRAAWLKERHFPENRSEQLKRSFSFFPRKVPWCESGHFHTPEVDFQSVIENDEACYKWLKDMATHGLTLIKNAPAEPDQLTKISARVGGFIRQTHYGSIFKVMSKPNPSNIAYSGHLTPLHVDLAYYAYQPCVQFLHCIEQTEDPEGGENYFVDGFSIADFLRKEKPEIFKALSTLKVTFRDIGKDEYGEFEKKYERPIIGTDEHGCYTSIAQNNFTRSSLLNLQLADVLRFYQAYLVWSEEINKRENQIRRKLQPGEIWAFDNIRVLHAREKYDSNLSSRYFEGMYLDWDEVYSTIRSLRRKLGFVRGDVNSFDDYD